MKKFCQSCAMPLTNNKQGTEKNNNKSNKYCNMCYQNGVFLMPHITFNEMKQLGIDGINNSTDNIFIKTMKKISYPYLLKKVERWKK